MNIAIIDDEPLMIKATSHAISNYGITHSCDISISTYDDGYSFLQDFAVNKFHILFMDIYMPGKTGVDVAKEVRAIDSDVMIIFLTSSTDHMPDAFSCHAFDYVVKPIRKEQIERCMNDCLKLLSRMPGLNDRILELTDNGKNIRIYLRDLASVTVSGHTVYVCTIDGHEYQAKQSFSSLTESFANDSNFLLVNRGVLINMDHVTEFKDGMCYLSDGSSYAVKVREKHAIEQRWHDYIFHKKSMTES